MSEFQVSELQIRARPFVCDVRTGIFLLFLLGISLNCDAGELRLTGNGPLVWNVDTSPSSPAFSIGIVEDPIQGTAGSVLGWQLELSVVGTPLSTGNLKISATSLPTAADYLFGTMSIGLSPYALPTDHINAIADAYLTMDGIPVPVGGKQLLNLSFEADTNAEGIFQLMAHSHVPAFDGSYWISDAFEPVPFADLNSTDGNILLGTITIVKSNSQQAEGLVPEPTSQCLIGWSMLLYALNLRKMRNRARVASRMHSACNH